MEEKNANSWEEFKIELDKVRREHDNSPDALNSYPLLFRGQENSCWQLSTTLDRRRERMLFSDYYRIISKNRPQIESLTSKEWPIPEYTEVAKRSRDYDSFSLDLGSGKCPGYAYIAYLRHHGFPSPLLDWSRSPYVAAFFAFNNAKEEPNSTVAIYVLSGIRFKVSGNRMPVVYHYGPNVNTHPRHFRQQSEYTLCLNHDADDELHCERYDTVFDPRIHQRKQGICWKITIPAAERRKVLKELDEHNLNAFSLFGSEESLMETMAAREFLLPLDVTGTHAGV